MTILAWLLGALPMVLAIGTWLVSFLLLVHLHGQEKDGVLRVVVRPAEEDEDRELLDRIGWRGALVIMVAYQVVLALSYVALRSVLVQASPRWFSANDYDLAFALSTAFVAARTAAGPPHEGLDLNILHGPWRIPTVLLLLVPWWFFPGGPLLESSVADIWRKPMVSRAEEFWTLFAVLLLWYEAGRLVRRVRKARNGRPTHG